MEVGLTISEWGGGSSLVKLLLLRCLWDVDGEESPIKLGIQMWRSALPRPPNFHSITKNSGEH